MSKLLQRLTDASRSGVYRAPRDDAVLEVTRGSALDVVVIDGESRVIEAIARALEFPEWFGGNWDALADSLGDLAWRPAGGHVLVFTRYPAADELGVLVDILRSTAEYWAQRRKPFFAVLVDPQRSLQLPDLYREA